MDIFEEIDSNLLRLENSSCDFENNINNSNNNIKELLQNQIKVIKQIYKKH